MSALITRLWVSRWGDIELYDIACSNADNETICNNEHDLHGHYSPGLLLPRKFEVCRKATSLNDRYHTILDVTTNPKRVCLLLSLLFLRTLLRKHDYLIMQYQISCWTTLISSVKGPSKHHCLMYEDHHIGGGISEIFSLAQLQAYLLKDTMMFTPSANVMYKFRGHYINYKQVEKDFVDEEILLCTLPLGRLINNLTITSLKLVAAVHGIYIKSRTPLPEVLRIIKDHHCDHCENCITVFKPAVSSAR